MHRKKWVKEVWFMRSSIVTLLILIVFILVAFIANNYTVNSTDNLLSDVALLDEFIMKEEWNEAKEQIDSLKTKWKDIRKIWELYIEHYEMDAIDVTIARLNQYVEIQDRNSALGEMAEFRLLVGHIKEKESFKLGNIL